MAGESDQTKEFEPSRRKLDEARQRGDLPRSPDFTSSIALMAIVGILIYLGPNMFREMGRSLASILANSGQAWGRQSAGAIPNLSLASPLAGPLLPLFIIPGALVLGLLIATKGLAFANSRVQPKLDRINPVKNAQQKYGLAGWVEFLKSLTKLTATLVLVTVFSWTSALTLIGTARLEVGQGLVVMAEEAIWFLTLSTLIALFIGVGDFGWQNFRHRAQLRMTREELKQETRESEGDPHLKQRRRQKAYDIATNRMLLDVPKAQVVVVNPTHFAVALAWNGSVGTAPRCVAKGVDEIALRIREIAEQNAVPIHQDATTARALYATVDLGAEIHPDHYRMVAVAIRFANKIRKKAGRLG